MPDAPAFHDLAPPPDALEKGGHEVLRACVVEGGISIALRRSFDDPQTWGVLLADLARHVARIYAMEAGFDPEEALAQIRDGFETEIDRPADPGTTSAIN